MNVIGIIPARMNSSRFPGKPLEKIHGMPMIGHCYHRTKIAPGIDKTYVATCDSDIADYIISIGGNVIMTADTHTRATTRTAEALNKIESQMKERVDVVVMVQGDEPLIEPETIDAVTKCLLDAMDHGVELSTGYIEKATDAQLDDPSVVHLVPGMDGCVITFSRLPVPYPMAETMQRTVHVGLYAFTRKALQLFAELERGPVERAESIEVMRYLEHGYRVACVPVAPGSIGVDTPEDLAKVEAILEAKQ